MQYSIPIQYKQRGWLKYPLRKSVNVTRDHSNRLSKLLHRRELYIQSRGLTYYYHNKSVIRSDTYSKLILFGMPWTNSLKISQSFFIQIKCHVPTVFKSIYNSSNYLTRNILKISTNSQTIFFGKLENSIILQNRRKSLTN